MRNGSGFLPTTQVFRTESYTYDANGNRATKTTAYGTITYSYDAENRLVSSGANGRVAVTYRYDNNGNLLEEAGAAKTASYEYNPQNRMVRSRVIDDEARTIASTRYGYDPLGRRTLVQDNGATTLRTLYDGLGFDVVKESPVYASGGFTDKYNTGIQYSPAGRATGERYRYLDDGFTATTEKYQYIEDNAYQTVSSRYAGERTMLYANGSPVAINRSSGTRGYLGTDILGSTRSVTDNHGVQESYYDYDIFGSPITGNYTTGSDYGYLGKPYDSITGLYNYGYRDYSPQTVRFTTVDPIRDGTNWFAYVNNDPVNYVDLWGLLASDGQRKNVFQMAKSYFTSIIDKAKDFMNSIKEAHYTRNRYNTPPLNKEEAEKLVANGLFIKMSETKDVYHEMGVASTYNPANNDKYVSVDGHIEGVYDENGNLVTDSVNQGTYNFANPNKDPIGHFIKDVIPYYIWGNSPDDPTSFWERVTGTYSGNVDGE